MPNGSLQEDFVTETGYEFANLGQVGVFDFCVNALGNNGRSAEVNANFDSPYYCSGMFVVYDDLQLYPFSFTQSIKIL